MVENLGPAASGFPANAAAWTGDRLYVVTLGLEPAHMAEYEPARRQVTATHVIPTGLRCWAMATVGRDVYIGMWGTRGGEHNLYRFDTARRTLHGARPVDQAYLAMAAAPDGRTLYLGTARSGVVFAYDLTTRAVSTVAFDDPTGSEVTALAVTADTLYVGLGRRRAGLVAIDRSTSAARPILPVELAGGVGVYSLAVSELLLVAATQAEPARVAVIDRRNPGSYQILEPDGEHAIGATSLDGRNVYFSGMASGTLYAMDRRSRELRSLSTPVPHVPTRRTVRSGRGVLGVAAPGIVFTHDLWSDEVTRTDLVAAGAEGGVERPQSLAVAGDQVVVGTNNAAQLHAVVADDPRSPRVVISGEAKTATAVGTRAFLATYPSGQLWRIGPEDPPERVANWPDVFNRPRAIHHGAGENQLMIVANADFAGGGALIVTDRDGALRHVHPDPLSEGQEPNAVTSLPGGVAVVGGIADDARLAAVDARTGRRLWETVPVPRGGRISGLATRGDTVYGLTRDATLFALDITTREVTATTSLEPGRTGELLAAGDALYAVDGTRLVRVEPATLAITTLAAGLEHRAFTPNPPVRVDARGRLYLFGGTDLLRVTDPASR